MTTYRKPISSQHDGKLIYDNEKGTRVHKFEVKYSNDLYKTVVRRNRWVDLVNEDGVTLQDKLNSYAEDSYAPAHARYIQIKQSMIYGKGIKPNLENPIVAQRLDEFLEILKNIDNKGTHINEQFFMYAKNMPIHAHVGARITYNALGKPRFITYYPTASYRCAETDNFIAGPDSFFTATDWSQARPRNLKEWPKFDVSRAEEVNQFLQVRRPSLTNPYYPFPKYYSAIKSINILTELSKMYLASIKNGMHNSGMLTMIGNGSTNEALKDKQDYIQDNFIGSENAGSIFYVEVPSMDARPTFEAFATTATHQTYYELRAQAIEDLMIAHGGHAEITGINTSTGFSSEAAMLEASYKQFKKVEIDPDQDLIVNGIYNRIFKELGWGDNAVYVEDAPWSDIVYTSGNGTTDDLESTFDEHRTKLSGRQNQMLDRILRKYDTGKLNAERAIFLLKDFGYNEADAKKLLMIEDDQEKILKDNVTDNTTAN